MASFDVVHAKALRAAGFHLRERGVLMWRIDLREPIGDPNEPPARDYVEFLTLRLCCDLSCARLVDATPASLRAHRDWIERHKDTPNEAFEMPAVLFLEGVGHG